MLNVDDVRQRDHAHRVHVRNQERRGAAKARGRERHDRDLREQREEGDRRGHDEGGDAERLRQQPPRALTARGAQHGLRQQHDGHERDQRVQRAAAERRGTVQARGVRVEIPFCEHAVEEHEQVDAEHRAAHPRRHARNRTQRERHGRAAPVDEPGDERVHRRDRIPQRHPGEGAASPPQQPHGGRDSALPPASATVETENAPKRDVPCSTPRKGALLCGARLSTCLLSRWPAMTWAMCGGRPLMMASVMKMRRKSCGV